MYEAGNPSKSASHKHTCTKLVGDTIDKTVVVNLVNANFWVASERESQYAIQPTAIVQRATAFLQLSVRAYNALGE